MSVLLIQQGLAYKRYLTNIFSMSPFLCSHFSSISTLYLSLSLSIMKGIEVYVYVNVYAYIYIYEYAL